MASKAKILKSIQHFDNVGKEIERFEERTRDAIAEPDCSAALIDVLKSKIEKYEKKLEETFSELNIGWLEINQLSELIIINHCTSKLHEEIAHRWELTLKPDIYPTLQAFRMFIESEARALGLLSGNADAPKSKLGTNLLEGMPIFGPAGTPTAIPTKLGYILSGKIYAPPLKESIVNSSLNDQLSELWKLEEVPKTNAKMQIPDPCEESFSKSVKRNNEGRYIVNLPFKENNTLGESKEKAVHLLYALENKFHKNKQFKDNFLNFMNEYLALGHMREISKKRDDRTPNCYIPYHMVINEKSTTTKCRVVFNVSSKTKNGKSLNDVLMTGPKLQTEIFNHLIKFRSHRIAFAADIEKMYRQILISDEDCKYQRIVWRATPSDSLKSFELQTITYDDLLSGADTEVEAKSIIIEIQNLLKSGGFILQKWSSSQPKVLQDLDTSLLASKPLHSLGDEESKQRVLGLICNLKTDSIQVTVVHEEIVKTKRQLLSVIARIDPLGLFSPSVITLKIMLQELWKSKAFWDDPIPSSILENWNKFTKESKYLNSISIPRFMGIDQNSDIILHGFCDASTKAYAAVVYLKSKQEIHLVSAKTRVAPITQLTIPRLELCGALLLAELISVIQKALRTKPAECFLWTDSTIVLSWLMKLPIKENIFVKK
ncbi:integrase catalytic domain-containing protein [Trichonephila clavipes]|nr:integrase catalytic domain-containing protein [Trichonephila clavipes]